MKWMNSWIWVCCPRSRLPDPRVHSTGTYQSTIEVYLNMNRPSFEMKLVVKVPACVFCRSRNSTAPGCSSVFGLQIGFFISYIYIALHIRNLCPNEYYVCMKGNTLLCWRKVAHWKTGQGDGKLMVGRVGRDRLENAAHGERRTTALFGRWRSHRRVFHIGDVLNSSWTKSSVRTPVRIGWSTSQET
jgi:hypothetical protein